MGGYQQLPITPYHPTDPIQQFGSLLALKNALAQQQLIPGQVQAQRQQLEAGALENQQRQQALKDQQAVTAAMKEWDGKDFNALPSLVLKNGGSGQSVIGLKNGLIKQQQDLANLSKDQLANQAAVNDQLLGHIETLKGITDPIQRAEAAKQQGAQILSSPLAKMLDPQTGQMIQGMAAGQVVPNDEQLDFFSKGLTAHNAQIKNALDTSTAAKNNAEANKINAETNPENPADPNLAKQKYEGILQKIQQGGVRSVPLADYNWAKSYENAQRKTTTSSDSLGINTISTNGPSGIAAASGGGATAPSQPGGLTSTGASMVDEIGTGKMALGRLDYILARKPQVLQAVAAKYPDFDSSKVKSYIDAYKDFTTGKTSQQINAGAIALQHLKQLKDINDGNPTTVHIAGTEAYNKFHNLLDTVTDELVTFYGEPKTNEVINAKKSTLGALVNRDAAISEQAKAMGVRMDEMEQRWKNAAPSSAYQAPMPGMSAAAKKARAALDPEYASQNDGGNAPSLASGMVRFQDSQGGIHDIPAANLDKAKQRDPGLKVISQ